MDEPTAYLDLPARIEIIRMLSSMCHLENRSIIFSTHDLSLALSEVDKLWIIYGNKVIQGAPEDMILNGTFDAMFKDSGIKLDPLTGNFLKIRPNNRKIGLQGPEPAFSVTERGLKRYGYEISDEQVPLKVTVSVKDDKYLWLLKEHDSEKRFNSLYELYLYLK